MSGFAAGARYLTLALLVFHCPEAPVAFRSSSALFALHRMDVNEMKSMMASTTPTLQEGDEKHMKNVRAYGCGKKSEADFQQARNCPLLLRAPDVQGRAQPLRAT
jgi:hypothetical protein